MYEDKNPFRTPDFNPNLSIGFGTGISNRAELKEAEEKQRNRGVFNIPNPRESVLITNFKDKDQPDENGFITSENGLRINPKKIMERFAEEEKKEKAVAQTPPIPRRKPLDSPFRHPILKDEDNQKVLAEVIEEEGKPDKNNFMFKDTAENGGKVTVAGGILLNTVEDAKNLPFTVPDGQGGRRRATETEIERAFRKVLAIQQPNTGRKHTADKFDPKAGDLAKKHGLDDLELPPEIAKRAFNEKVRESVHELRRKFPEFDDFPSGSKRALLDMEFNMGIRFHDGSNKKLQGTGWPNLFKAIGARDWKRAANESRRDPKEHPGMVHRNDRTKKKFLEALEEWR